MEPNNTTINTGTQIVAENIFLRNKKKIIALVVICILISYILISSTEDANDNNLDISASKNYTEYSF